MDLDIKMTNKNDNPLKSNDEGVTVLSLPSFKMNGSAEKARNMKFWMLTIGIIFFFGCHNYMQELIMSLPGFKVGVFLGYLEVLGVTICSYFERMYQGETTRKASWSSYFALCIFLLISSATSNIALNYINYPTKVVFRSCKLVPTMIIAVCYNKKHVYWFEFLFGTFISLGLILFAAADFTVYPDFNTLGQFIIVHIYFIYILNDNTLIISHNQ